MIRPEQVFLAVEPVDMRWGMERLSCHVQHHLGHPPSEGSTWAFVSPNFAPIFSISYCSS